MALEYRFLLRLERIANNRELELMEFLKIVEPKSGKNKWRRLFDQAADGKLPIIHRSNNELMVRRMAWSIYQSGGFVLIEDLASKDEADDASAEPEAEAQETATPAAAAEPPADSAPAPAEPAATHLNYDVEIGFTHTDNMGHVAVGTLARLLESLRFRAVKEDAFSMSDLFADGAVSVVRAQEITILDTLYDGDALNIDLKLVNTGSSSLRLGHKVTRDGDIVAKAAVVAVHLGKDGKPAPLPDGVQARVTPDVDLPAPPKIASPAPKNAWSLKTFIRQSDIDALQHANQGHIVRLLDDVRLLAQDKVSNAAGELRRIVVNYERELKAGDNVTVLAWNDGDNLRMDIRRGRSNVVRALIETTA